MSLDRNNSQGGLKLEYEDDPIGPLEIARENLEKFADSLIIQDSLRKMIDWMLVLKEIVKDSDVSDLERKEAEEEIKMLELAWTAIADSLYEQGISC